MQINKYYFVIIHSLVFICYITTPFIHARYNKDECVSIAEKLKNANTIIDHLFFLPDDAIITKKTLIGLISQETKNISAALFYLSEPDITHAFEDAFQRGVCIELIIDQQNITTQVLQLCKKGVPVFIYQSRYRMHHKTLIFHQQNIIWTGSLNLTSSGFNGNAEYVTVRNAINYKEKFLQEFHTIKNKSDKFIYSPDEKQITQTNTIIGKNLL